jgi:hypothetical protein
MSMTCDQFRSRTSGPRTRGELFAYFNHYRSCPACREYSAIQVAAAEDQRTQEENLAYDLECLAMTLKLCGDPEFPWELPESARRGVDDAAR